MSGFLRTDTNFYSFKVSVIRSWGFFDLFKVPMIRYSGFVDSFEVPIIHSWGFFESFEVLMIRSWGLFYLLKVRANARDDWNVWRIRLDYPIFRVPCPKICTLWLDRMEYPLFRVISSSYSTILSQFTVQSYFGGFFVIKVEVIEEMFRTFCRLIITDLPCLV